MCPGDWGGNLEVETTVFLRLAMPSEAGCRDRKRVQPSGVSRHLESLCNTMEVHFVLPQCSAWLVPKAFIAAVMKVNI